ncbi:MAG TPA: hypothetical protein VMD74_02970 [Candidatus Methylomirabilis sp.]|nr:hypothetical protein [Candidatus Methylomirabilis sp.]
MTAELNIGGNIESPKKIETILTGQEARPELGLEKKEMAGEQRTETGVEAEAKAAAAAIAAKPIKSVISEYEEREKQIENFLARGLEDIYLGLPLEKQAEFRQRGEETAKKINKLLEKTKINLGKIVNLIKKWLSLIPGVNKYFLEQEAKIKADEIIKLRKKV